MRRTQRQSWETEDVKGRSLAMIAASALVLSFSVSASALADEATGTAKAKTTGSTKPHLGNGPAVEKSLPNAAPAPTTTRSTGARNQDHTVKAMNSSENAKVQTEGK
jgi:hypothetical protein